MGIICPKCGKNNNDRARFCTTCGMNLTGAGNNRQERQAFRQDATYPTGRNEAGSRAFGRNAGGRQDTGSPLYGEYDQQQGSSHLGGYPDQAGPIPDNRYSDRVRYPEGERAPYPLEETGGGRKGGNGARIALLAFAAILSLLIITLSVILIRSRLSDHSTADSQTTRDGQKAREGEKTTDEATSTSSTTATESASQTTTEDYDEVTIEETDETSQFEYCNNQDINILYHEEVGDFQKMTSGDGSFTFSYPKYIFNHVDVNV